MDEVWVGHVWVSLGGSSSIGCCSARALVASSHMHGCSLKPSAPTWELGSWGVPLWQMEAMSLSMSSDILGDTRNSSDHEPRHNVLVTIIRSIGLHPKIGETSTAHIRL